MVDPLKHIVDDLEGNPVASALARRAMFDLLKQDRARFLRTVVELLKPVSERDGYRHLLRFLIDHGVLYTLLGDANNLTLEQGVAVGRSAQKLDPQIDAKLAQLVVTAAQNKEPGNFSAERAFEIAVALTSGVCLLPILVQLLRSPNGRIRSRAALLVGRMAASARPMGGVLSEEDGRVRANAVESLWGLRSRDAEAVFRSASQDSENRTAGNGLVGLYKMGVAESIAQMLERARHPEPRWRATAAWAMGAAADPRFVPALKTMLTDPEPGVRRNALTALARIKRGMDQRFSSESLRLSLCAPRPNGDRVSTAVVVTNSAGDPVTDLLPTQFIVWRDGAPVPEFEVAERKAIGPLTIGFASAVLGNSSHPLSKPCLDTITGCLKRSRDVDRWLLTELTPPIKGVLRARTPKDVLHALESGQEIAACNDLFHAAGVALGAMPDARGARQIVLIGAPPPSREDGTLAKLLKLARETRTTIHAVSYGLSSEVGSLCRGTGGSVLAAITPEAMPALAEGLYLSMVHRYDITLFTPGHAADDIQKVEVYSEDSYAEAVPGGQEPQRGSERPPGSEAKPVAAPS
ncbi:MAG: HEAT repeat domain-containing protein [Bryobacteraceae bacterium]